MTVCYLHPIGIAQGNIESSGSEESDLAILFGIRDLPVVFLWPYVTFALLSVGLLKSSWRADEEEKNRKALRVMGKWRNKQDSAARDLEHERKRRVALENLKLRSELDVKENRKNNNEMQSKIEKKNRVFS